MNRQSTRHSPDEDESALFQRLDFRGTHPLVGETGRYLQRVATELARRENDKQRGQSWVNRRGSFHVDLRLHGRIDTHGDGRLRIVATLRSAAWILSFHDKLLKALESHGCAFEVHPHKKKHAVVILAHGAHMPIWFSEDFDKQVTKEKGGWPQTIYVAKDTYQLKAEPDSTYHPKVWRGDQQKLDSQVNDIAAALYALLADEAKFNEQREIDRQRREERAAEMKIWFAEQELKRKRKEERRAQVGRLLQAASGHEEYVWAAKRLSEIEAAAPDDEAVRVWVEVVRENLTDPHAALIKAIQAEAAKDEKPLWWPEAPPAP